MTFEHPIRRFTFAGVLGGAFGGILIPTLYVTVWTVWEVFVGGISSSDGSTWSAATEMGAFLVGFGAVGAALGAALGGLTGQGLGIAAARRGLPTGRLAFELAAAGAVVGWVGLGLFFRSQMSGTTGAKDLIEAVVYAMVFPLNPFGALGGAIGGWIGGLWLEKRFRAGRAMGLSGRESESCVAHN